MSKFKTSLETERSPNDYVTIRDGHDVVTCPRCQFNDHGDRCINPGTIENIQAGRGAYCGPHHRYLMREIDRERMLAQLRDYRIGLNNPAATYANEYHYARLRGEIPTGKPAPANLPYDKSRRHS